LVSKEILLTENLRFGEKEQQGFNP